MTAEYSGSKSNESNPVRETGPDYYDRYYDVFPKVQSYTSSDFKEKFQLYNYEDRTRWPPQNRPLRLPMPGERHPDVVPVSFV